MTGNWWADGPIIAAALLTAWYTIWKRGLKPLARAIEVLADAVPVLITLRETVIRIEAKADAAGVLAAQAVAQATAAAEASLTNQTILRSHVASVDGDVANVIAQLNRQDATMDIHLEEDRAGFAETQAALRNLQQDTVNPHPGSRP